MHNTSNKYGPKLNKAFSLFNSLWKYHLIAFPLLFSFCNIAKWQSQHWFPPPAHARRGDHAGPCSWGPVQNHTGFTYCAVCGNHMVYGGARACVHMHTVHAAVIHLVPELFNGMHQVNKACETPKQQNVFCTITCSWKFSLCEARLHHFGLRKDYLFGEDLLRFHCY